MTDALDTCNACDAIGIDPDSLAGYCQKCETEARSHRQGFCGDPSCPLRLARSQEPTVTTDPTVFMVETALVDYGDGGFQG